MKSIALSLLASGLFIAPAFAADSDAILGVHQAQIRSLQDQLRSTQAQLSSLQTMLAGMCDGVRGTDNKYCYKYTGTQVTHAEAEQACVTWGGHLASVHSDAEMNTLASLMPPDASAWLGAVRQGSSTTFAWNDGTTWDKTFWWGMEPNNAGGVENCALTGFHAPTGWADFPCSTRVAFLCKKLMVK